MSGAWYVKLTHRFCMPWRTALCRGQTVRRRSTTPGTAAIAPRPAPPRRAGGPASPRHRVVPPAPFATTATSTECGTAKHINTGHVQVRQNTLTHAGAESSTCVACASSSDGWRSSTPRLSAPIGDPFAQPPVITPEEPPASPHSRVPLAPGESVIELYSAVAETGVPNYIGARLPVKSSLNIPAWRLLLANYPDSSLPDFLEFGWPINIDSNRYAFPDNVCYTNHHSAIDYSADVDSFIAKELEYGALCGPFRANPFPFPVYPAPLQTVEKRNSTKRRVVVDLSYPAGHSVNDAIPKDTFLARRDPRRSRDAQKALRRPRDNGLLDADLRHPRDMDNQRDLRRLRGQASRTKWAAFADGTWSNLRTILRTYLLFCTFYCLTPFPASVDTLEPFAEMLARSFRAPASIANYLGGLRSLHVLFGWTVDAFLSPDIALMKRGLQRRLCHTPRQVAPFTPDILLRILEHLDMTDPFHATIWTLLILSFFTFQRKSNFLPKGRFDPAKQCTIHDFQIFPNYMLVRIRWSKTIQCAERVLYLPVLAIPESPLCPVAAFRHMLKLNPYDGLAVFTVRYSKRVLPMSQAVFDNAFKRVLVQAGLNPQSYSLHSGRRGGATFAFRSGVPVELIKIQGDWRSNAYLLYLKVPLRKRLELCDMMVKRLRTPCSVLHYD
ncbi:uncharacterized protein [Branchiostoma lanceolatum]|uniref:uncharacterized protein isoform X1 n=1 Tax=Branchiostoma lanceolatum TaxID=7740 RepID=UPI003456FCF1